MKLLIAPHCDDETLFAAYTIMRLKPLVLIVTDDDRNNRGITAEMRRNETTEAMKILGAEVKFLGIPESKLTKELFISQLLSQYLVPSVVFTPAIQGGHQQHDLIGSTFDGIGYATYTKDCIIPAGNVEVIPTKEEIELKNRALDCYKSQFPWNQAHFDAVRGRSEFYVL